MKLPLSILSLVAVTAVPCSVSANDLAETAIHRGGTSGQELPAYLQCVPFARAMTGVAIYGDALSWWDKAEGRYDRGRKPTVGAVMAFRPHRNMVLGHVAAVSKVIDSRTVLISHANWSPIDGRRGQIERDVRAVDVSPDNDWSQVRVWYHPLGGMGKTAWPVAGFIYAGQARGGAAKALAPNRVTAIAPTASIKRKTSTAFSTAFAKLSKPQKAASTIANLPARVAHNASSTRDPVRDAIALYEK